MKDKNKTKAQLLQELTELRDEITRLKTVEADCLELKQQGEASQPPAQNASAKLVTELETVAQVSVAASNILETDTLLQEVVNLTKTSFKLYHAHIYLLNDTGDTLNLVAGAGQIGQKMVAQGWSIPLAREQSLVARAARSKHGVIVNNVLNEPGWLPNPLLPNTRSELAVPMLIGDRVLGVLDVQSDEVDYFTEEDVRVQTTLAAQVAVAVENARLFEDQRAAVAETELLYNAGRRLNEAGSLDEVVAAVADAVPVPAINRAVLALFEHDEATGELESMVIASNWYSGEGTPPTPVGTRYNKEVFEAIGLLLSTEPLFFDDVLNDKRVDPTTVELLDRQNIRAMAVLPLWVGTRQLGALLLESEKVHHFDESEIRPYIALSGQMAVAVDHQHLLEQAHQRATELEEATNFLDSVLENIPTMLFIKDAKELRFVRWNKAGEELVGYPREAMVGKNDYDFFPKEEADFFVKNDQKVLAGGELVDIPEEPIETADGQTRWLHTRKVPVYGSDGKPRYLLGISEDITERKQVEEELRTSEARNRALLNAIPDLIIRYDSEGLYLDIKESIGFDPILPSEELIGKKLTEVAPGKMADTRLHYIKQALKTGQIQTYEQEFSTEQGVRYEEVRVVPIGQNEAFAVIRDITSRKQEEAERERLLVEVQRLAGIVEHHPDFIGVGTLDGKALYVNPAGLEMMGLPPDHDVTQMDASNFYPPQDAERLVNEGLPIALEQGAWSAEANLLRVDGTTIPVDETLSINYDADGEPVSFSITMRDITERKEADAERERLLEEVQAAYRQYVRREWQQFLGERHQGNWHIEHRQKEVPSRPTAQTFAGILEEVLRNGQTKVVGGAKDNGQGNGDPTVVAPLSVRGEVIGTLSLQDIDPDRNWSDEEIALVETVSEQLALTLENMRLFEDTQQRASREELTRQITDKMRASPDIEAIIHTGLTELANALGVSRSYVKLSTKSQHTGHGQASEVEAIRKKLKDSSLEIFNTGQPHPPATGKDKPEQDTEE